MILVIKYIVLLLLLLLLIGFTSSLPTGKKIDLDNKVIWTYWDDPNTIPELVKICIKRMQKFNPDYKVIVLNKNNYKNYVSIPNNIAKYKIFNESKQRFSDLLRLYVLAENGGIWIDASILLNSKLNVDLVNYEFSAYYLDGFTSNMNYPVIESWFFACTKNSEFVKKWRDEFIEMRKFNTVKDYIDSRKEMGLDFQNIGDDNMIKYLAIHISAQKVLQIDKYPISKLELKKAEDGPYKYLVENDTNWNIEKGFNSICEKDYDFIKIGGGGRSFLDKNQELSNKLFDKYKV